MCERVTLFGCVQRQDAGTSAACGHYWESAHTHTEPLFGEQVGLPRRKARPEARRNYTDDAEHTGVRVSYMT